MVVTEGALHIWDRRPPQSPPASLAFASPETVRIRAADGVSLDAWLCTPPQPNGAVVVLLHGVGDTRLGMLRHADFLLGAGYAVLLPDARGHGASGGTTISYGIWEAADLRRWSDWLAAAHPAWRQYSLGVSMGAAILLESLAQPTRFRAAVAESSFVTFEDIAYDRMEQRTGLPGRALWPVVQAGFWYTRARYGIDLWRVSPADGLRSARIPVLLIHGSGDHNIPLRHSLELQSVNPVAAHLWVIPAAAHAQCLSTAGREYQDRVIAWFAK